MGKKAIVNVYQYADYRAFLTEYYLRRKQENNGFSLRMFSRQAGLKSPNYLKLVMDGDRNLTPAMAIRFGQTCGLSGERLEYFCELVAFNQAQDVRQREYHYSRLKRFGNYRKVHKLDAAQAAYHSEWFIPAIRELLVRQDFKEDPNWISQTLLPPISPNQVRKAMSVLFELGLITRDEKTGRLRQAEPLIETPDGILSHHIANFHRAMMAHAAEALDRVPHDNREIASLTLCLSRKQMKKLKVELEGFRQSILQRYQAKSDAEYVVQLNLQMFPLSSGKE